MPLLPALVLCWCCCRFAGAGLSWLDKGGVCCLLFRAACCAWRSGGGL